MWQHKQKKLNYLFNIFDTTFCCSFQSCLLQPPLFPFDLLRIICYFENCKTSALKFFFFFQKHIFNIVIHLFLFNAPLLKSLSWPYSQPREGWWKKSTENVAYCRSMMITVLQGWNQLTTLSFKGVFTSYEGKEREGIKGEIRERKGRGLEDFNQLCSRI